MISFIIHDVKPCSINAGYYKTKKVLTLEGRRFRKRLLVTINQNRVIKDRLLVFRKAFDPNIHGIKLTYFFFIPKDKMYTGKSSDGPISMASGDVDNYFKLTTDFLFNPKYLGHPFDKSSYIGRIENFGIDDRFILDTRAFKMPSTEDYYSVGVKARIINKTPKSTPEFILEEHYKPINK